MRVLTDDPAAAATFLPDVPLHGWQRDRLEPCEASLAAALGGTAVWSQDVPEVHPFWATIVVSSVTEVSQFDALDALIARGSLARAPVVCAAISGERFHGQRGRQWAGARGNLHVSVAVPIGLDAANVGVALSMLPAVAAVDAIAETTGDSIRAAIKWVNDIVIGDRKAGGVLTTAHTTGRTIDDVVWGVGINVDVVPAILPTPFVRGATSLRAEAGAAVDVSRLLWALLAAIARRHAELTHEGPQPLASAYRRGSVVIGREVQVWEESACADDDPAQWGPPFAEGVVADIADDLSLRLDGHLLPVTRGRLALRAPHGESGRM
jgi:biotin-[acetyl-CoA-carboxylase] ligase BirA-like protein